MTVIIPPLETGKVNVFIDDLIDTYLDLRENLAIKPHAIPLTMHVTSRPHAGDSEPIVRQAILSLLKFVLAEGSPAEQYIVFGSLLDTWCLLESLPNDKYSAWLSTVADRLIKDKDYVKEDLDTLERQLNHIIYMTPLARHFFTPI